MAMMATLWHQLTEIYGARFVNQHGEKHSTVWFQALHDLQDEDIEYGLHTMMRDARFETWPPNCTQFRHLCQLRRTTSNLPTAGKAFEEARLNQLLSSPRWSHPAIKLAVNHVGVDVINSAYTHQAFKLFADAYQTICESVRVGHEILVVDELPTIKRARTERLIPKLADCIR